MDPVEGIGMPTKTVFISYSHDSDEHRGRVLELSERLREDGITTILDQYLNGSPTQGWPRWMLDSLDAADFVLVVCTPTYYTRFRGHETPGRGTGVDWEGALITQELYDSRGTTLKFVPIFVSDADARSIPEPLRGRTYYTMTSERDYQRLYDQLLDQGGVRPRPVGDLKLTQRRVGTALRFDDRSVANTGGQSAVADSGDGTRTFYYLSSRRIINIYDQLPDDAFRSDVQPSLRWVATADIDAPGMYGSNEQRLRTYQRQLAVILNYWAHSNMPLALEEVIAPGTALDPQRYYRFVGDFAVQEWEPRDMNLTLHAGVGGYTLIVRGSKENFPGLFKNDAEQIYEANSLMPDFFIARRSMRLLALVQCQQADHHEKTISAGALCLLSPPAGGHSESPL